MNPEATLVFEGTVRRLGDSTVATVQPDRMTAVVHVDRVLRAPPDFEHLAGREITVLLASSLAVGRTSAFSTVGWIYGESLAVIELERESAGPVAEVSPEQQRGIAWTQTTQSRVTAASQIVLGQVAGLRPHPRAQSRLSEHNPDWWLADVDVDVVLKGSRSRAVAVTFANSLDVMWRTAPKLLPHQKSILLLHDDAEELPDRRSRAVLNHRDVHSPDKLDTIAAMI
jgi:hypothetical protein